MPTAMQCSDARVATGTTHRMPLCLQSINQSNNQPTYVQPVVAQTIKDGARTHMKLSVLYLQLDVLSL